jgi:pilus assembly protein CpaF
MLLGRISDAVDLSALRDASQVAPEFAQRIERAATEQAKAMADEGEAPQAVDLESVARAVVRELVGVGAFGPLLDDDRVSEIHCTHYDHLSTVRDGAVHQESFAFSSEEALVRALHRLAHQSGDPWRAGEPVLERRLQRSSLVALAPPVAANHVASIRKRMRVESTLEDLVRESTLSKAMAQFLEACTTAGANVLVAGAASGRLLSALASTGQPRDRVCVVHDVEDIGVGGADAISMAVADTGHLAEDCVRAAARLRPSRLVVAQLAGAVAAATLDAMAEGHASVLAAIAAPTLRQGLSRLVAQLVLHRPGLGVEAMRDVVGEAFDMAIEVATLADGRLRVIRIAELCGSDAKGIVARDLFVFNADNADAREGAFGATGVVPRLVTDLAARGTKMDPALFKRAAR